MGETHQMAKLHESRQWKGISSFEGFCLKKKKINQMKTQARDYLGGRDPKTLADCVIVRLWS